MIWTDGNQWIEAIDSAVLGGSYSEGANQKSNEKTFKFILLYKVELLWIYYDMGWHVKWFWSDLELSFWTCWISSCHTMSVESHLLTNNEWDPTDHQKHSTRLSFVFTLLLHVLYSCIALYTLMEIHEVVLVYWLALFLWSMFINRRIILGRILLFWVSNVANLLNAGEADEIDILNFFYDLECFENLVSAFNSSWHFIIEIMINIYLIPMPKCS